MESEIPIVRANRLNKHCGVWRLFVMLVFSFPMLPSAANADEVHEETEITRFVDEAIATIREHALAADDMDWSEVRAEALRRAADAHTTAGAYPAIRYLLTSLHDNHSFLQLPQENRAAEVTELGSAPEFDGPEQGERKISPYNKRMQPEFDQLRIGEQLVGYLFMPQGRRNAAFARDFQQHVAELKEANACGWIVDLRGNGGGDIGPMMLGLGPLLGEGEYVGSVNANGLSNAFLYRDGVVWFRDVDGQEQQYIGLEQALGVIEPPPPTAVLFDRGTGSSGEIMAVAFHARPNTRTFGEPTYGASTFTQGFQLSDGANLVLAVSVVQDVNGNLYHEGIEPEVDIPTGEAILPRSEDTAIQAALAWLSTKSACKGKQRTP